MRKKMTAEEKAEKMRIYQREYYQKNKEARKKRKLEVQKAYSIRTGYAAQEKYKKNTIKQISLQLNLNTDKDILQKLNEVSNKQGYIKELIRKDISEGDK